MRAGSRLVVDGSRNMLIPLWLWSVSVVGMIKDNVSVSLSLEREGEG